MTEERRQEILDVIAKTSFKGTGTFEYSKEIRSFPELCEEKETVPREADSYPYSIYVFKAKNRSENCPVYINIHGGGFIGPHRDNDDFYSAYLADRIHGIVADIDYTLSDRAPYPAALHQCMDALSFVRENVGVWGTSEARISIGGYSAGGALTAAMGIELALTSDFRPALQIICYAPLDYAIQDQYKPDCYDRVLPLERSKAFADLYFDDNPEYFTDFHNTPLDAPAEILAKQPRTLIISAGRCNFRFEDEDYALLLADAGVPVTLKRFPDEGHGFIPHFRGNWREASDLMVREILDAAAQ